jgi:hypothetical protein
MAAWLSASNAQGADPSPVVVDPDGGAAAVPARSGI